MPVGPSVQTWRRTRRGSYILFALEGSCRASRAACKSDFRYGKPLFALSYRSTHKNTGAAREVRQVRCSDVCRAEWRLCLTFTVFKRLYVFFLSGRPSQAYTLATFSEAQVVLRALNLVDGNVGEKCC